MSYLSNQNQPASTEEIFKSIRKRISKLELEPGSKISENQMCEEYGVSRSVIRNVFVRLQQLRLIDVYPQRGTYVSMIDFNFINDILLLRTAVEKQIIGTIFEKVQGDDFENLVKNLEINLEKQELYRNVPYYSSEYKKVDSEFHKTLIDSASGNGMVELLSDLMIHLSRWRNFDVLFDNRIPSLIEEHRAIVEGIKSKSLEQAIEAISIHLETISKISDRAKAEYPQYFL